MSPVPSDELAQLREENEALKLRVAWLEGELGLSQAAAERDSCRRILGVTKAQAFLLCTMARSYPRSVQRWALEETMPGKAERESNFLSVHVCLLRRRLGADAIVTTEHGYRIGEAACARVLAAIALAQPAARKAA